MRILAITNMLPTPANPWLGNFVEQQVKGLKEIGVQIEVLSFDRAAVGRGIYIRMRERIRRALGMGQYDLVHVMYGGIMAELATQILVNVPSVITIHGSDLFGERLSNPIRRVSAHIGVVASRRAARRADGIITVSAQLRDALPRNIDRTRVRVIPCGVDFHRFKPVDSAACRQQLGWDPDAYHILIATNGDPVKRPKIARQAVNHLLQHGVRAELHEMRGIPYGQVPTWINASHTLILTSLHEGSPMIVKECLACNVPVVSVDVGDVRERTAGIDGCFIVPANEADLASGLQAACSARDLVNSRDRIRDLSLTCIAERISQFYRDIIASRSGQRL